MGYSFSNIQLKQQGVFDKDVADRLAALLTEGKELTPIDNEEEADGVTAVIMREDSPWITIVSDLFDGDVDVQLAQTKAIALKMQSITLAIACFDSDYLFLNLIDPKNQADLWASCGRYPDGKAPRRSNFAAWKAYVPDVEGLRTVMHRSYFFAEECLNSLEPLLTLPPLQSLSCVDGIPEGTQIWRYFYKANKKAGDIKPPVFKLNSQPFTFGANGEPNVVPFVNRGDASRGVAVVLAGPCIDQNQIRVESICLQYHDSHGEWLFDSINLEERPNKDGMRMLYGENPTIRIPQAVTDNLPWKKKMNLEFMRALSVRFTLSIAVPELKQEELDDLHVILIPLKNWEGQCGWVLKADFGKVCL